MKSIKRPLRWWWLVLMDLGALCAALLVFALFHHVLPRKGEARATIVSMPEPTLLPTEELPTEELPTEELPTPELPTPEPTYAPGDFSATFPAEDTSAADALQAYQSDDVRISVTKVRDEENRITSYVADIWVRNIAYFRTAFAEDQYGRGFTEWPVDIAQRSGAIVAVTGDYYGARDKGVVIRNGEYYRNERYRDVCVLYVDGSMKTYGKDEFDIDAVIANGAWQAWGFGPALINADGTPVAEFGVDEKLNKKNPRCGIGYYEPGHYCLVLVDGRQGSYSKGMTLTEFAQFFADLGCVTAYNLDGGKTAAMVYENSVISQPFEDGRRVSDIIYIPEGAQQ